MVWGYYCMFVSVTYGIQDCTDFDSMTSSSNKWSVETGVNTSYSNNGVSLSCASWNGMSYATQLNNPSIIEYEITSVSIGSSTEIGVFVNFWSSNDFSEDSNIKFQTNWLKSEQKLYCKENTTKYSLPNGVTGKYLYKIYSDRIELYKDDTLVISYSTTNIKYVKFTSGNNNDKMFTFKNFKIKPL